MKKKSTSSTILASIMAIILCFTTLVGTTFAWFTDSTSSSGNIITSGKLDVNAYWMEATLDPTANENWIEFNGEPIFNYSNWEPGYVEAKHLKVTNEGSLAFKFKLAIEPNGIVSALADVIDVYYFANATQLNARTDLANGVKVGTLAEMIADPDGAAYGIILPKGETPTNENEVEKEVAITIAFLLPTETGNQYMNMSIGTDFDVVVYATQYDYESDSFGNDYDKDVGYDIVSKWDGETIDVSWYNNTDTEFDLNSAAQFAGFAALVNGENTSEVALLGLDEDDWDGMPVTFEGKTVKLTSDISLYCEDTTEYADGDPLTFRPIGDHSKDGVFEGTFDGDGHTISDLFQNGWDLGYEWGAYGSYGLFGNINNATIKNLIITGSESYIEGGDTSFVAGSATGTCVFENITIKDSISATYNNGNGGIIGWSGAGDYTFKNITIEEDCVLAGLWGSFDSSIGGIVGQAEPGATYNFENVTVSCRLDVYNDVTASYDYYNYRMCGMLIGRCKETITINGANYPDLSKYNFSFNNVVVNYGDWMNYRYCRAEKARGIRVEAGYAYDGIAVDYDHSTCTVHHMKVIPFDQLVGGDQYAVKGLKEVVGVTVNYPASYLPQD